MDGWMDGRSFARPSSPCFPWEARGTASNRAQRCEQSLDNLHCRRQASATSPRGTSSKSRLASESVYVYVYEHRNNNTQIKAPAPGSRQTAGNGAQTVKFPITRLAFVLVLNLFCFPSSSACLFLPLSAFYCRIEGVGGKLSK